jgi:hypothetical protein
MKNTRETSEEKEYTIGFNSGYIVEKYGEPDPKDLNSYEFETPFMQGVVDGKNQAVSEKTEQN